MALVLGRIGSIGKLYWFMPPSVNLVLCELDIVLFLAVVELKSGSDFVDTMTQKEGLSWIGYGIFITAIPLESFCQNKLSGIVWDAGRFDNRSSNAGICQ